MKRFAKRACAMLLVLMMCLSLISGLSFEAAAYEVDYNYQGSVVYNWGERGEKCDFLSPMAEDFYTDNSMTYDYMASLSGSSTTNAVPSSAMYKCLQKLMADNHKTKTSYDATKNYYDNTDCQNGGGKISSFYSGVAIGPGWGEGGSWNREHTWPNSKGLGGQDENDIMMLRPTATSENSSRGNDAYGESADYYDPNDEAGGKYNLHGDVARIWLYVYVRWGNTSYAWGKSGVMESKEVLLKWMEEDPVDTWEMGRNDAVESITGTRNVFVDYPELAFLMFNEDVPVGYQSPSGEGNPVSYTVTAVSNNTGYGTVSCTGRTITATPKTGYYVQGYTVTSGSAVVTQNGNTFNVQASSDCTIRINFAAKTGAWVSFYEDGAEVRSVSCYQGDYLTLPSHTTNVPEGYAFKGWVAQQTEDTATEPTAVYAAGQQYLVTGTQQLYALYYYRTEGTGSSEYVLTDISQISATDEVVITVTKSGAVYAMTNNKGNSSPPVPVEVTVSDDRLTQTPADELKWNISNTDGNLTIYPNGSASTWLYCTNKNNGVRVGTDSGNKFVVDSATGYLKHTGTGRYLGIYNIQDWRCYTSTSINIGGQTLGFYVKGKGGTTYYTTFTGAAADKFAVYSGTQELDVYKTLNQALEDYDPSSEYIKLLENANVQVTLDRNVYIDLNGYYLSGTMETGSYAVYGMDTTTDQYSCEDVGYFTCVDAQGQPVVPEKHIKTGVTGNVQRYLAIKDDGGYSFHRFYMGIIYANLRPGVKGVGYKATFAGDDMVKAQVDSFGYTLQLGSFTPLTASKAGTEMVSLDEVTLRIEDYDADNMGTTKLTANVFMVINGEKISSNTVTITLKDLVETINELNNLTDTQKTALVAWIAQSETMQSWKVNNIYTAN